MKAAFLFLFATALLIGSAFANDFSGLNSFVNLRASATDVPTVEPTIEPLNGCYGAFYKVEDSCVLCVNGLVTGDENGNTGCIPCGQNEFILNGQCVSVATCNTESYDSIMWAETFLGYTAYTSCESDEETGYYTRVCSSVGMSTAEWNTYVDKSHCVPKTVEIAEGMIDFPIHFEDLPVYQSIVDIPLHISRAVIAIFPYLLSELHVSPNAVYTLDNSLKQIYRVYIRSDDLSAAKMFTDTNRFEMALNFDLHEYDPKLFNEYIRSFVNDTKIYKEQGICTNPVDNTDISYGFTTGIIKHYDASEKTISYLCDQYHNDNFLKVYRFADYSVAANMNEFVSIQINSLTVPSINNKAIEFVYRYAISGISCPLTGLQIIQYAVVKETENPSFVINFALGTTSVFVDTLRTQSEELFGSDDFINSLAANVKATVLSKNTVFEHIDN